MTTPFLEFPRDPSAVMRAAAVGLLGVLFLAGFGLLSRRVAASSRVVSLVQRII
jgi:hypothetical protein